MLYHDSYDAEYRDPIGPVPAGASVTIRFLCDEAEHVTLRTWDGGEARYPMQQTREHLFESTILVPEKPMLFWYDFIIHRPGGDTRYGTSYDQLGGVGACYEGQPSSYQITVYDPAYQTPEFLRHAVVYQIFPDRFFRDEKAGHPGRSRKIKAAHPEAVFHKKWDEAPFLDPDPVTGDNRALDFFGGTLRGIAEKLDELQELGVTVLYLNPIFRARTNHRYDTGDYAEIDPILGDRKAFDGLIRAAKARGMRVMLDGVFSHTGSDSLYFNRYGRYDSLGAYQSTESPYYPWYTFEQYPDRYRTWWGFDTLPAVNKENADYQRYLLDPEDGILPRWVKKGACGWRLDVVHMLGEGGGARNNLQHIAGITQAAKQTQPEAFVFGEHFGDARQWLQADAEDAAMNYRGFTFPIWGFLANTDISYDPQKIDAQTCMAWMDNYRAGLSHQQQLRMFNQLDSHDTARFKSLLGKDVARLPLAVVWLFTWPGVPCIYYGDEVGLDGKNDPFCRKPFPWQVEKQDTALFALYQRMIALRKKSQALRRGGCQVLYAEDNVVVFVRVLNQQRVLVAINRGEACEVVLPASPFLNVAQWQRKEGHGQLTNGILALPAISATVWMN